MTRLTVWAEDDPEKVHLATDDSAEIMSGLAAIGIRFERWAANAVLPPGADQTLILATYSADIDRLKRERGYATADVVRLAKGTPNTAPIRSKFLDEHTHAEDEVRFFVEGSGAFYLRGGSCVHQVVCEAGDLLSVTAHTRHWFDMGDSPYFTAIRLFTDPAGWVARFTGDSIARRFPAFGSPP